MLLLDNRGFRIASSPERGILNQALVVVKLGTLVVVANLIVMNCYCSSFALPLALEFTPLPSHLLARASCQRPSGVQDLKLSPTTSGERGPPRLSRTSGFFQEGNLE